MVIDRSVKPRTAVEIGKYQSITKFQLPQSDAFDYYANSSQSESRSNRVKSDLQSLIYCVSTEIRSKFDELKTKVEKERQNFAKALSKSSKECENLLKNEAAKFQAVYENFCKDKNSHLQALKDAVTKYEDEKEKLFMKYEQHRKKEKNMITEHEKACATKIAELEESLKKKKQVLLASNCSH